MRGSWIALALVGFALGGFVLVVAVLALLVVPTAYSQLERANVGKVKADIVSINASVQMYQIENNGRLPARLEDVIGLQEWGYGRLDTLPFDPWERPYLYDPETGEIWTNGRDGEPGGEGPDADISRTAIQDGDF